MNTRDRQWLAALLVAMNIALVTGFLLGKSVRRPHPPVGKSVPEPHPLEGIDRLLEEREAIPRLEWQQ